MQPKKEKENLLLGNRRHHVHYKSKKSGKLSVSFQYHDIQSNPYKVHSSEAEKYLFILYRLKLYAQFINGKNEASFYRQ